MPFDVVVLDLRLPDMNDLSLLRDAAPVVAGCVRLILMTAFGTPEILADAEGLGAAVINKPFELNDLTRLCGRILLMPNASTILVVDDEPLIRWSLVNRLKEEGYRTLEAGTASDAIVAQHREGVDLVLLDYRPAGRERARRC